MIDNDNPFNNKQTGKADPKNKAGGLRAVLEQSLQSYDKLPMLEVIFDKFIRQLSTALRNLTSEPIEVSIKDFAPRRFGNYFDSQKEPYTIVIFKAVEWENFGLLILENNMIFSFVDLLLGGKKSNFKQDKKALERKLTSIEQGLARQLSEVVLEELGNAFEQVSPATFTFDRLESNPNFVSICRPGDAIIVVKFEIEIDEQVKHLEIMIPYKTVEPVKEQMQQVFLGDKFGNNKNWEKDLTMAVFDVDLDIEAVIINNKQTVKNIAGLKVGDTLLLDHAREKDILIRSGHVSLFNAKLGKVGDKLAVDLKEFIED